MLAARHADLFFTVGVARLSCSPRLIFTMVGRELRYNRRVGLSPATVHGSVAAVELKAQVLCQFKGHSTPQLIHSSHETRCECAVSTNDRCGGDGWGEWLGIMLLLLLPPYHGE